MAPWCGKDASWAVAGTINPCIFNPAAAAVLVVVAAAVAWQQGATARRLSAAAAGRSIALPRGGGAAVHAQLGAAAVLLALHGFALLWVMTQVPQPPYVAFSEALLLAAWGAFLVSGPLQMGACVRAQPRTAWHAVQLARVQSQAAASSRCWPTTCPACSH